MKPLGVKCLKDSVFDGVTIIIIIVPATVFMQEQFAA